mmetsp:Transcript_23210/g.37749  ORF Transcript_23210/g.37749 Transcript_23210/m.37749 type:complete len:271 (-) Transcript_23210:3206-4018(-)
MIESKSRLLLLRLQKCHRPRPNSVRLLLRRTGRCCLLSWCTSRIQMLNEIHRLLLPLRHQKLTLQRSCLLHYQVHLFHWLPIPDLQIQTRCRHFPTQEKKIHQTYHRCRQLIPGHYPPHHQRPRRVRQKRTYHQACQKKLCCPRQRHPHLRRRHHRPQSHCFRYLACFFFQSQTCYHQDFAPVLCHRRRHHHQRLCRHHLDRTRPHFHLRRLPVFYCGLRTMAQKRVVPSPKHSQLQHRIGFHQADHRRLVLQHSSYRHPLQQVRWKGLL